MRGGGRERLPATLFPLSAAPPPRRHGRAHELAAGHPLLPRRWRTRQRRGAEASTPPLNSLTDLSTLLLSLSHQSVSAPLAKSRHHEHGEETEPLLDALGCVIEVPEDGLQDEPGHHDCAEAHQEELRHTCWRRMLEFSFDLRFLRRTLGPYLQKNNALCSDLFRDALGFGCFLVKQRLP